MQPGREAQKKNNMEYIAEYNRKNTSGVMVRMYQSDSDIVSYLDGLDEPKATYIKRLIREDMKKKESRP